MIPIDGEAARPAFILSTERSGSTLLRWLLDAHPEIVSPGEILLARLGFDLYFPGYDSVGQLIQADLLRPLNADYLGNRTNLWDLFSDPWWDRGARYTIPSTVSTRILRFRPSSIPSNISLTCWLEVGKVPTEWGKSLPHANRSRGTRWPILSTGASRTMRSSMSTTSVSAD